MWGEASAKGFAVAEKPPRPGLGGFEKFRRDGV